MRKGCHSCFLLSAFLIAVLVLAGEACTDNGDTSHGPTFGPLPKVDAGDGPGDGSVVVDPDGGATSLDGAADAPADTSLPCDNGTIAVVAGTDTTLSAAIKDKNADWAAQTITSGAAKSKPAVAAFGAGGFIGVTHGAGDVLQTFSFAAPTWSAATTIGSAGVKGSPALGIVGTKAHLVYAIGGPSDFTHGIHDGVGWNAATGSVGAPPQHSFGTVSAGVVGVGADLLFAENGTNNGLYVRTFDTAWSASTAIVGAGTVGTSVPATPELVSIEGTGQLDAVLVFAQDGTRRLSFATREASSKTWSTAVGRGGVIHLDANTAEKLTIARAGTSGVLVAFRGQDGKGYSVQGTIAAQSITWTAASPVGGVALAVDSPPALAKGICGDDAIATYASAGIVNVTRLRGATWTTPEVISGIGGNKVAIATK